MRRRIGYGIAVVLAVAVAGCGDDHGDQLTAVEAGELCETGEERDSGNLTLTVRPDMPDDHPESFVSLRCVLLALDTPDDVCEQIVDSIGDESPRNAVWDDIGATWVTSNAGEGALVVVLGARE